MNSKYKARWRLWNILLINYLFKNVTYRDCHTFGNLKRNMLDQFWLFKSFAFIVSAWFNYKDGSEL